MRKKSNPKFVLGYTDTETVKLDLDSMPFRCAKYWALRALKQFRLKGFIILKSSCSSYHVVFDKPVSWRSNVGIIAWVSLMTKHRKLTEWLVMQLIKHASTLRVSAKGDKPSPRIVYSYGSNDQMIRNLMKFRRLVRSLMSTHQV